MATTTATSQTTGRVEEVTEETDGITQITSQESQKRKSTSSVLRFIRQYIGTNGEAVRECIRCCYKFSKRTGTESLKVHLRCRHGYLLEAARQTRFENSGSLERRAMPSVNDFQEQVEEAVAK